MLICSKKSILLLSMLLIWNFYTQAQTMESVFGQQYYKQHLTGLFPNGNWVILGLDSEMPGSVGRDSITIHLLNTQVDLLSQIPVQPPRNFESFELKNVLITSDSTFAIAYAGGDCDACCYMSYLDGYSINGELIWRHEIDEYADLGRTCFVNDEKNISILYPKSLTTYSGATGEELSSYTVVEDYPDGVIKVPGVDEMIVLAYPNVRVLRFNATIDEYEIILEIPSAEIGNYLEAHWQGQDYFYALDYPTSIVRVYRDLRIETIATFEGFLTDFTVKDDTIYILDEENYNQYNIIRLDTTGQKLDTFVSAGDGLRPTSIHYSENGLLLAGSYDSGPNNDWLPAIHHADRKQLFTTFFPGFVLQQNTDSVSLKVVGIDRNTDLQIDTYYSGGPDIMGDLHDFEGGNFQIEVENDGHEPVSSFWLNTVFDFATNYWFCAPKVSNQRHLTINPPLQPGQKRWVTFGDVHAFNQSHLPSEFCFWTSGPNDKPDDEPDTDVFCIEGIVSTEEPTSVAFSLLPNPAFDQVQITVDQYPFEVPIRIFNTLGTTVKNETIPMGEKSWNVDVSNLPAGMYYVRVGTFAQPLVIVE